AEVQETEPGKPPYPLPSAFRGRRAVHCPVGPQSPTPSYLQSCVPSALTFVRADSAHQCGRDLLCWQNQSPPAPADIFPPAHTPWPAPRRNSPAAVPAVWLRGNSSPPCRPAASASRHRPTLRNSAPHPVRPPHLSGIHRARVRNPASSDTLVPT